MSALWFRFKLWLFLHGFLESNECPNCGKWTPLAPGYWPSRVQRQLNLNHWKGCEA